jgi:hypothetical protein
MQRKRGTNKTIATCQSCGVKFQALRSDIERGKDKYCSHSCAGKAGIKPENFAKSGNENFNWKGGISTDTHHYRKTQRERFPEHFKARRITTDAIRTGKIKRKPCEICGYQPANAHHDDYSKPLEVRWLCDKHHREAHGGMRWNRARRIVSTP